MPPSSVSLIASLISQADCFPHQVRQDARGGLAGLIELNTGVVYFRQTAGAKAMVQSWRKAMLHQKGRPDLTENVNDQSLFNQVRQVDLTKPQWASDGARWSLIEFVPDGLA